MINSDDLLIVVDPGHGGWDNGASFEGRLEKDDNLNLGLELQKQLNEQGIPVLMTRNSDVYVTLADRVQMANSAGADLFVSLHRNSYPEHTPTTNGVENFIYLTAPEETSGKAAKLVLDEIVNVGVQSNRGVSRANFYVIRRTNMPSMLLEMGFIIDEIDNQLFDEHLVDYAMAITKGIMQYFGLEFQEIPGVTPAPPPPVLPPDLNEIITIQTLLNQRFGLKMPLSGIFDSTTKQNAIKALQMALNSDFNSGLTVNGTLDQRTLSAFPSVQIGQRGNVVLVIQALLGLNKYNVGNLDGIFGIRTQDAVKRFQANNNLFANGVVNRQIIERLLAYS